MTLFLNKEIVQPATHGGQERLLIPLNLWGGLASFVLSLIPSLSVCQ